MDFRKSILRFVRVGFRRTENPKIRKFGRASEERKPKDSRSDGLSCSEERENSKIRSGGLPKKGKPRNQDSIWRAFEKRKTKKPRFVRSGRLPKNENPKIRSGGLLKNDNPKIRSGGLPKNENPKIKIRLGGVGFRPSGKEEPRFVRSGGLLTFGKRGTKIRSGGVGFRPSGKEEPRFISLGCLGCLLKNGKNQRFVQVDC
ncbi:unnamed protein product [Rhizophagus irregularis]|uniref:Uncharacterized protein n=1 Tax=Rhizophagus irregularis TaxID=588596 RepID=A0A916EC86_9GLOM|nr:unnamed protein product [Rhizophagus irregularis]